MICMMIVATALQANAQKNVTPAQRSGLAGISLPAGSRSDNRLLSRSAASALLEMEAKEKGTALTDSVEVLILPVTYSADSLGQAMKSAGYDMTPVTGTKNWLAQKANRVLWCYYDQTKTETNLYIAVAKSVGPANSAAQSKPAQKDSSLAGPAPAKHATNANVGTLPPATPAGGTPNQGTSVAAGKYAFTTTNFDDGWVAIEKPDWIEVTKGELKVLLHFSNTAIDMSSGQTPIINANAWNVLVAPRYTDKREYHAFNGNMSYLRSSATSAIMTDKLGAQHFVVLFRRGGGLFIEFISPDRASFEKEFGMNISAANNDNLIWSDDALWMKMDNMQNRNKFAVAPQDLAGHWSESSGSIAQMYYVNTGNYAGMNAVSNSAEFWLNADGSYRSQHKGASGMVGNQSFFQQEYKGRYSMNGNWEVSMTNRYNGKTDVFWCQFECVRIGRILHLTDKTSQGIQYHLVRAK